MPLLQAYPAIGSLDFTCVTWVVAQHCKITIRAMGELCALVSRTLEEGSLLLKLLAGWGISGARGRGALKPCWACGGLGLIALAPAWQQSDDSSGPGQQASQSRD